VFVPPMIQNSDGTSGPLDGVGFRLQAAERRAVVEREQVRGKQGRGKSGEDRVKAVREQPAPVIQRSVSISEPRQASRADSRPRFVVRARSNSVTEARLAILASYKPLSLPGSRMQAPPASYPDVFLPRLRASPPTSMHKPARREGVGVRWGGIIDLPSPAPNDSSCSM
jgi:hypothetical protein